MIETLILGFFIGVVTTAVGAAYAAYRVFKKPYIIKDLPSGYTVAVIDQGFDNDKYGYIGLKKDGNIIGGMKFDEEGVTDIVL